MTTNSVENFESDENFLKSIITDGQSQVYCYHLLTSVQHSQWKTAESPQFKKAHRVKGYANCFFDYQAIFTMSTLKVLQQKNTTSMYLALYEALYEEKYSIIKTGTFRPCIRTMLHRTQPIFYSNFQ